MHVEIRQCILENKGRYRSIIALFAELGATAINVLIANKKDRFSWMCKRYLIHVMIAVLLSYQEGIRSDDTIIWTYATFHYTTYYTSVVDWFSRLSCNLF